jgi:hypothetical protein
MLRILSNFAQEKLNEAMSVDVATVDLKFIDGLLMEE